MRSVYHSANVSNINDPKPERREDMLLQYFCCGSKGLWQKHTSAPGHRYFVVQKGFRSMFRNNQPFSSTQALQCTPNNSGNLWQDCSTDPISWGLSWNSSVCIITSRLELNIAQWIVDHGLPFLLDYSVPCCSLAPWLYIKNLLLWKNIQSLLQNVDFLTKS